MTCRRRPAAWNEAGVWEKLHLVLLKKLRSAKQLDWSRAVIDSSQPTDVDQAVVQAAVHRSAPTTMLGQQRQAHRRFYRPVRTQNGVHQLEQLIASRGQTLVELAPQA